MEKTSRNTAPPEAVVPNAAAGSCPERPVQPSDNEIQPEPVAASSPPPEIASLVEALSPENIEKEKAEQDDILACWDAIIERLGMTEAVLKYDMPDDPARALADALLHLPDNERHNLSRRFPLEIVSCVGAVLPVSADESPEALNELTGLFLAPEVLAAFNWRLENTPREMMRVLELTHLIN